MTTIHFSIFLISCLLLESCDSDTTEKQAGSVRVAATAPLLDVKFGTKARPVPISWAALHAPPENWIKIGNRVFEGVMGENPFYLTVDATRVCFFVEDKEFERELVLVDRATAKVTRIAGDWGRFGLTMGRSDPEFLHELKWVEHDVFVVTAHFRTELHEARINARTGVQLSSRKIR